MCVSRSIDPSMTTPIKSQLKSVLGSVLTMSNTIRNYIFKPASSDEACRCRCKEVVAKTVFIFQNIEKQIISNCRSKSKKYETFLSV